MKAGDLMYCTATGVHCLVIRTSIDSVSFWKILRQGQEAFVNERYLEKISENR